MDRFHFWPTSDHDYDLTDADGYPTEAALKAISEAPHGYVLGMARTLWYYPDYWSTGPAARGEIGIHHHASTGGWSGNESVIRAMMDNTIFWAMHWEESRRGGHHTFREQP